MTHIHEVLFQEDKQVFLEYFKILLKVLKRLKEESKLRAVASDGHRLVLLDRDIPGIENVDFEGFIIARKAAKQLEDIAEDELVVKLGYTNNYVVIWTSNSVFFTRTIEGTYPDYRSVIPSDYENI